MPTLPAALPMSISRGASPVKHMSCRGIGEPSGSLDFKYFTSKRKDWNRLKHIEYVYEIGEGD